MTKAHDYIKRPRRRNRHKAMTVLERWEKEMKRKGILPQGAKVRLERSKDSDCLVGLEPEKGGEKWTY